MPMTGMRAFDIGVKTSSVKMMRDLKLMVRVLAMQVLIDVVRETRVKTGRARGNWSISIGGFGFIRDTGILDPSGGATISAGNFELQKVKPFGIVYVQNGLIYIEMLEGMDHMAANAATRASSQFGKAA